MERYNDIRHNNGQLFVRTFYRNGKMRKKYGWYSDGQPWWTEYFNEYERREGEYKEWHKDGHLYIHSFHRDGDREGKYKSWYSNGNPCKHEFYRDGRLEGERKCWHENGWLARREICKNGLVVDMDFSLNKKIVFLRLIRLLRNRTYLINSTLISDLAAIVLRF